MKNMPKTTLAIAAGAVLTVSLTSVNVQAAENPFFQKVLDHGYMACSDKNADTKGGESKCGGDKTKEGKCGNEAGCGGHKPKTESDKK